jgi:hypothetical protein
MIESNKTNIEENMIIIMINAYDETHLAFLASL